MNCRVALENDKELEDMIKGEEGREENTLTLIASENYVFPEIYKISGSVLTNKYSEGRVGARYYGGTEWVDKVESLCQKRALDLFSLDPEMWGVSVQPHSGSIANFSAYSALTKPGGKIMGMDLPSGGHLTHGFQTKTKKVSGTSLYFTSSPYVVNTKGEIDYEDLQKRYSEFSPEILICGYTAHSQDIDYKRLKELCGDNSFLLADISHITALVAAGLMNNPFEHCDVVTMTTHKGLRGPRGAMIFYRKEVTKRGVTRNLDQDVSSAVFPLMQGGPHNHTIGGIAYALKMAKSDEFKEYARRVVTNAKVFAEVLREKGYSVLTGGTVNHMVLVDLKNKEVGGGEVEHLCEVLGISINKNAVPGDKNPLNPSGIRLGTYGITTRGMRETDTKYLSEIVDRVVVLCQEICRGSRLDKREMARRILEENWERTEEFSRIKDEVSKIAWKFKVPGLD
jgi:glycine hydroxymethyltransferase